MVKKRCETADVDPHMSVHDHWIHKSLICHASRSCPVPVNGLVVAAVCGETNFMKGLLQNKLRLVWYHAMFLSEQQMTLWVCGSWGISHQHNVVSRKEHCYLWANRWIAYSTAWLWVHRKGCNTIANSPVSAVAIKHKSSINSGRKIIPARNSNVVTSSQY